MDDDGTPWESRALPSLGAVRTAATTCREGHELTADLRGLGPHLGEPHTLLVTCHPIESWQQSGDPDVTETVDRWPTLQELLSAADLLAPGSVFYLWFVAQPEGMERGEPEPGTPRTLEAAQVGAVKDSRSLRIEA